MRASFLLLSCILALAGCQPELRTIGTVEEDKLITPKTLSDMGYEAFREAYLGEEVTVSNFYSGIYTGAYKKGSQCKVAFRTRDEDVKKEFLIYAYSNDWPDSVMLDHLKSHDDLNPALLNYPDEVTLPADVCDESCEYDAETGACFYKSPNLKITGKLFQISGRDDFETNLLFMKVKGVVY